MINILRGRQGQNMENSLHHPRVMILHRNGSCWMEFMFLLKNKQKNIEIPQMRKESETRSLQPKTESSAGPAHAGILSFYFRPLKL